MLKLWMQLRLQWDADDGWKGRGEASTSLYGAVGQSIGRPAADRAELMRGYRYNDQSGASIDIALVFPHGQP